MTRWRTSRPSTTLATIPQVLVVSPDVEGGQRCGKLIALAQQPARQQAQLTAAPAPPVGSPRKRSARWPASTPCTCRYKTSAQAITDLVGGQLHFLVDRRRPRRGAVAGRQGEGAGDHLVAPRCPRRAGPADDGRSAACRATNSSPGWRCSRRRARRQPVVQSPGRSRQRRSFAVQACRSTWRRCTRCRSRERRESLRQLVAARHRAVGPAGSERPASSPD